MMKRDRERNEYASTSTRRHYFSRSLIYELDQNKLSSVHE
jgi:hypothetical protein